VFSYTRPAENIFQYDNWQLQRESGEVISCRVSGHKGQGKSLRVKLEGVGDRDQAQGMVGLEISTDRAELPELDQGEFYWRDLIGLTVRDTQGVELGVITDMMETGSNDVILLKDSDNKALAIPWTPDVVIQVDLAQSLLIADWKLLD
jgi:16S rRNA processing protein RimM